jgi:hypothetical protein
MFFPNSRLIYSIFAGLFILQLLPTQLQARWLLPEEANIECLDYKVTFKINEDGTYTVDEEQRFKILTEAGRQRMATQAYTYDTTLSRLDISDARTTTSGVDYIVPRDKIETKPLASDGMALSQKNQILIPFQQLEIGSVISLKKRTHAFLAQIDKCFEYKANFSNGILWNNVDFRFESKLPLNFKLSDYFNVFDVTETKGDHGHVLQFKSKRPHISALIGESQNSFIDAECETGFAVSTETSYERCGKIEGKTYQEALESPMPEPLKNIIANTKNIKDEAECIDTVVTHIIEKITYLQSRTLADGHIAPRSLQAIIDSGYGDCKEYSTCLAAVLKALGYKAQIAFVQRKEPYKVDNGTPGPLRFDHAIVKAIAPSGRVYWIDPTNDVVMSDGIFADIADRPVLVIDAKQPTLEHIPAIDYRHAKREIAETISIKQDGSVLNEGTYSLQGETAMDTALFMVHNKESVYRDVFLRGLAKNADLIDPVVDLRNAPKSRKVIPFSLTYSFGEENVLMHTNQGYAFPLESHWQVPYIATSKQDVGAIYVGHPETRILKLTLKNARAKNLETLAFDIKTPWLNAKRELVVKGDDINVTTTVEIMKGIIPAKDLKSQQFCELREKLRKLCHVAILLDTIEPGN